MITSTFRGHGHALAKGLTVQELLDELFGAVTGCCKGKGGSMHVGNLAKGMIPGIAIVGGGIPVAAGMALALKMQQSDRVVACFFGDGAVSEGAFHEGVNMAAIWNLPVVFACENNLYGASTHISQVMRDTNIARRTASYGLRTRASGRQRRAGGLRSGAGGRRGVPGGAGAGVPGAADLPLHRPLAPRPVPLPAQGRTRRVDGQRSARAVCRRAAAQGLADEAELAGDPARIVDEFNKAVARPGKRRCPRRPTN